LSLAVARLLVGLAGLPDPSAEQLAALSGRGLRSGIGLHGFRQGGLIVDGGRRQLDGIPPLLARLEFPPEWSILILIPKQYRGLHGLNEARAFAALPPIPDPVTDRLCRLVLLGLLPAVIERNLLDFGEALAELQQLVGRCFASAQGGIYARPELDAIVAELRSQGLQGVGQSSWGPTLYGFSQAGETEREVILRRLRDRFGPGLDSPFWTSANREGFIFQAID
jgi:beta-RFAP synthase